MIPWVVPLPTNSHHQDYHICRIGNPNLNLHLPLANGRGDNPTYTTSNKLDQFLSLPVQKNKKHPAPVPDAIAACLHDDGYQIPGDHCFNLLNNISQPVLSNVLSVILRRILDINRFSTREEMEAAKNNVFQHKQDASIRSKSERKHRV